MLEYPGNGPMEYDNDDHTWHRRSSAKAEGGCHRIPKNSSTVAVVVLGLAVLSCLLGYCVLSETLPYESKTLRLVVIVSNLIFLCFLLLFLRPPRSKLHSCHCRKFAANGQMYSWNYRQIFESSTLRE